MLAAISAGALAAGVVWGCADRTSPAVAPGDGRQDAPRERRAPEPTAEDRRSSTDDPRADAQAPDRPARAERSEQPPPAVKNEPPPKPQPEAPPKDPPLPKYIRVLERDDPKAAIAISAVADRPDSLELRTTNVQRFRIDRRELATPSGRSIALRLDDQVIEWTARYSVLEFARDEQGFWQIVDRLPARP